MKAKLCEILPVLFSEVEECLRKLGRGEIVEQLGTLRLDRWTHDSQADAMYLYVIGEHELNIVESNIIGVRVDESIPLDDMEGIVVIDVDNFGRVQGIELIGRRGILKTLRKCSDL